MRREVGKVITAVGVVATDDMVCANLGFVVI